MIYVGQTVILDAIIITDYLKKTMYDCSQMIITSKKILYQHVFDVKQPVYILKDLIIFSMFLDVCDEF